MKFPPNGQAPQPSRVDVLVVDDSPVDRLFYRRALTHGGTGWNVVDVASPLEAIAICQLQLVGCVLTDFQLPEMSGLELIERLRTDPKTQSIPIVLISGTAEPSLSSRALVAGASAVLGKGLVNLRALREAVETAMRGISLQCDELLRAEFAYACVSTTGVEREPEPGELERFAVVAELSRLMTALRTRR